MINNIQLTFFGIIFYVFSGVFASASLNLENDIEIAGVRYDSLLNCYDGKPLEEIDNEAKKFSQQYESLAESYKTILEQAQALCKTNSDDILRDAAEGMKTSFESKCIDAELTAKAFLNVRNVVNEGLLQVCRKPREKIIMELPLTNKDIEAGTCLKMLSSLIQDPAFQNFNGMYDPKERAEDAIEQDNNVLPLLAYYQTQEFFLEDNSMMSDYAWATHLVLNSQSLEAGLPSLDPDILIKSMHAQKHELDTIIKPAAKFYKSLIQFFDDFQKATLAKSS